MSYFFLFLILFLWLATLSSLAGDSFPIRSINIYLKQKLGKSLGGKLPEILLALTIGSIGTWGWDKLADHFGYNIPALWLVVLWAVLVGITLGAKESGTHGYLQHEGATKDKNNDGVIDNKDLRMGTMSPWNIWLASRFGFKYGDEGFSWVWAFTKGFMTTAAVGFLGMVFQPIGREVASHAEGRLSGDPNFYMEFFGDGYGYAKASTIFVLIVNIVAG